jgi:hypothetical protein
MRPLHPLPTVLSASDPDRTQKKKRRAQAPLIRARRQRIDPTKYGSVHISGVLLDTPAIVVPSSSRPSKMVQRMPSPTFEPKDIQKVDEKSKKTTQINLTAEIVATPKAAQSNEIEKAFAAERARNLALLSGLFGDKDVWEGHENNVGEGAEANEPSEYDEDLGPTQQGRGIMLAEPPIPTPVKVAEVTPSCSPSINSDGQLEESASIPTQQAEVKRLKDLFAPTTEPGT